ncbi:hypothetical protein Mp_7g01160 [Marchantia polymorpha subsp. ruderalis]|uniref:Uncharacterized protein n=2 Tax=Marchantia polymorpha TaxID=3197 RepID=A0AAF6BUY8_MARPO|nr:hypothetical protein MARPO_0046s0008 [Marchantia polymorpha]BBN15822.1 hypothetical protein Mp_7g01160 [Marchantia polymorpha subsp. ruderalis]|eukprot:PTQ39183.1 hypothetical protein MARPO_0046s0008 [Marchantia polymorpha]
MGTVIITNGAELEQRRRRSKIRNWTFASQFLGPNVRFGGRDDTGACKERAQVVDSPPAEKIRIRSQALQKRRATAGGSRRRERRGDETRMDGWRVRPSTCPIGRGGRKKSPRRIAGKSRVGSWGICGIDDCIAPRPRRRREETSVGVRRPEGGAPEHKKQKKKKRKEQQQKKQNDEREREGERAAGPERGRSSKIMSTGRPCTTAPSEQQDPEDSIAREGERFRADKKRARGGWASLSGVEHGMILLAAEEDEILSQSPRSRCMSSSALRNRRSCDCLPGREGKPLLENRAEQCPELSSRLARENRARFSDSTRLQLRPCAHLVLRKSMIVYLQQGHVIENFKRYILDAYGG